MKIITIIGARPQFIKAAPVSRAIAEHNNLTEVIIHTGQHFDANMSDVFFRELNIPKPDYNLGINSASHGAMTGRMLEKIEEILIKEKPDRVLVYGDTNSTLAGALAAVKLHVPVAHVEAGLRSFNRLMPEEINRVMTDHISSLLFCPTTSSVANLANEGITEGVYHVGDVMYDAALAFGEIAAEKSLILTELDILPKQYRLATVHRAENTDIPERLLQILSAFEQLDKPVIFPVHPRTRKKIADLPGRRDFCFKNIRFIDPVSFLDMMQLEKQAACVLTDSGGVQKEACFYSVPCVTLRDETEWVETVEMGWNQVVGANQDKIISAVNCVKSGKPISEYGDGRASEMIVDCMENIK